jgi:tetratricopeptide (TPR) repeat protein
MSYYKGRLYLYFGVTPVLILFWPFLALTGQYLSHGQAAAIFCGIGFLASMGILHGLWRRYFPEVSVGVVTACALALGLATSAPMILPESDVYEVAVCCGYALTMLGLSAIWRAVHDPARRCRWLAAASVAYGLAIGARPSLLMGAVVLFVPVIQTWRERRQLGAILMAAIGPIFLIGVGLMMYNALRFDSPFEFGLRYQLSPHPLAKMQLFGLHYLSSNSWVYLLKPVEWSKYFPFVSDPVQSAYGVLTNIPLAWLALTVPLAWRNRWREAETPLRWFVLATTLWLGINALIVSLYFYVALRFVLEFLPALALLAVIGILQAERLLANRPIWRRATRCGWGALLGFSVALNLLAGVDNYANAKCHAGYRLFQKGEFQNAIGLYHQALRIKRDSPEAHIALGIALCQTGQFQEAITHFEHALRIQPNFAEAHYNLAFAFMKTGRLHDAIASLERALQVQPDFVSAQNALTKLRAQSTPLPVAP